MGVSINGKRIKIEGRLVRMARLEEEWYEDVENPDALIDGLRASPDRPDILTFWQRLPEIVPKYTYCLEHDSVAAIPIQDYSSWWEKQISAKTRNMVRRAEKKGVVVKPASFDDTFVEGMKSIFDETPVRQGKPFWHYGKDVATLKREFSRFLFREEIFGAYVGEELVGFIFLADAGKFAALGQIISKIAHRDKAPNNILIARAVERCAEKKIPHLVYAKWVEGSLGEFKRSNGFQKYDLPRFFVPLTLRGRLFVSLKLYRGVNLLPGPLVRLLKNARGKINHKRHQTA